MRLIAAGLFASLVLAVPASAQTANPSATETKEAKPEKPKKICRSIEVTGQRIPRRECKTETEWSGETVRDSNEDLRLKSTGVLGG